jgi:hypothetical protein
MGSGNFLLHHVQPLPPPGGGPAADEDLPDDTRLMARVRSCLGDKAADELGWELEHFRSIGAVEGAEALRERWFSRMWDVSAYMAARKLLLG